MGSGAVPRLGAMAEMACVCWGVGFFCLLWGEPGCSADGGSLAEGWPGGFAGGGYRAGLGLFSLGRLSCGAGEDEALEGAGGAFGDGAEGADEVHVAAELEAFDGDDADGTELELLLDGPF
jgi:hypothetical protein